MNKNYKELSKARQRKIKQIKKVIEIKKKEEILDEFTYKYSIHMLNIQISEECEIYNYHATGAGDLENQRRSAYKNGGKGGLNINNIVFGIGSKDIADREKSLDEYLDIFLRDLQNAKSFDEFIESELGFDVLQIGEDEEYNKQQKDKPQRLII